VLLEKNTIKVWKTYALCSLAKNIDYVTTMKWTQFLSNKHSNKFDIELSLGIKI
jgi:hypothetical protein